MKHSRMVCCVIDVSTLPFLRYFLYYHIVIAICTIPSYTYELLFASLGVMYYDEILLYMYVHVYRISGNFHR